MTNISKFLNEPLGMASELSGTDVASVYIGPKSFKYVYSPDIAFKILTSHSEVFRQNKTIFDRIKPVTGNKGLVQLQGEESRRMRKLIMPSLLNGDALANVSEIILKNTTNLIDELSKNNTEETFEVDISMLMTKLILKSAFEMFLGVDLNEVDDKIVQDYLDLNFLCGDRMRSIVTIPLIIPTRRNHKINKLSKGIRREVLRIIKIQGTSPLLKVLDRDKNLIDHCLTFLFAGHETMASSLSFSFLKLANFQESQDIVRMGDKKMINAFYNETLRMYPPAYMLVRECLVKSKVGSYTFKKNDQIIIPLTKLHRCPQNFPNPEIFKPERFLTSSHHKGSFLPFGTGEKSCAGTGLAYLEAQIVMREICRYFKLTRYDTDIKTNAYITLHPAAGQTIKFTKRKSHE